LIHSDSAGIINNIITNNTTGPAVLRIDDTMPINVVPAGTPKVQVYTNSPESDLGPWPLPANPLVEKPSDYHMLVIDQSTCILYEAWLATKSLDGTWMAGSTAKWDLNSNALRTNGWTSGDASGTAITAGVLKYDDIASGEVKHALRVTAPVTFGYEYTWPARHYASHSTDVYAPKMGQRLRLKASVDISGFTPRMQIILRGLQKYGMIVADNGMALGMQHDQDTRWDAAAAAELAGLHSIPASSFEVVDASPLMTDPDSGIAVVPPPTGLYMTDLLGRKNSVPLGSGLSVQNGQIVAGAAAAPVTSVANKIGDVKLYTADITNNSNDPTTLSASLSNINTSFTSVNTALNGKQNLLGYTPEQALTFLGPLSRSGNTISCPTCQSSSSSAHSGTAAIVSVTPDSTHAGTWKGTYGSAGYVIVGDTTKLPTYATVNAVANQTVTWDSNTSDTRALQKAANGRVAAAWYNQNGFTIEVNIGDNQTHKVSLYFLDWDNMSRSELVTVTDLSGNVLDTPVAVNSFGNGKYWSWNVSGRVIIRVTNPQTPSAATKVVSGIFFD
jgi:hypothetical protein